MQKLNPFLELGEKYVDHYLAGKLSEETIAKFQSIRECLFECYLILIKQKEIVPIEAKPGDEKQELWNECKKYCEPLSSTDRIKFVKAYAALSCLMNKRL